MLWNPKVQYRIHKTLHLFLFWARPFHSTSSQPTSKRSFRLAFPPTTYTLSSSPHSCYMPQPSHLPRLDYSNYTWRKLQSLRSFLHKNYEKLIFSLLGWHRIFCLLFIKRNVLPSTQSMSEQTWQSGKWNIHNKIFGRVRDLHNLSLLINSSGM
jgi:hypothetical protein